jgi:fibronectin type 3 domain-containing protein
MKLIHRLFYLSCFLIPVLTKAQFLGSLVEANVTSGAKGNYIFLFDNKTLAEQKKVPNLYANGEYCSILRSENGIDFKEIAQLRPIQSAQELNDIYGSQDFINVFRKYSSQNLKSAQDVIQLFQNPDNKFENLFLEPILLYRSLGLAYEDRAVVKGKTYFYKVEQINKQGIKKQLVEGNCQYGKPSALLNTVNFKGLRYEATAIDSMVLANWLAVKLTNRTVYAINIYATTTAVNKYKMVETKRVSYKKDSLVAVVNYPSTLGEVVKLFVVPIDYLGNEGNHSDTITIASIPKHRLPIIKGFSFQDTTDAVFLKWNPLPPQPFISGIILTRVDASNGQSFKTLDTLNALESSYFDRSVKSGVLYNYEIYPLFGALNNINASDVISSRTAGMHQSRQKTLAPTGLKVELIDKFVKLSWKKVDEELADKYVVYAGTSPQQLKQISKIIADTVYIDSTLHGDLAQYTRYFTVAAIGRNQQISVQSSMVSIRPNQPVKIPAPEQVILKSAGNGVLVEWIDLKSKNSFVESYQVFRRNNSSETFKLLNTNKNPFNQYFDSTLTTSSKYEYAVRAIGIFGDESEFSLTNTIAFVVEKKNELQPFNEFSLRNIPPAIEIAWIGLDNAMLTNYSVYRKSNTEDSFIKIATLPAEKLRFWDKTAAIGQYHVYAISYTLKNGEESPLSDFQTIQRIEIKED